MAWERRGDQSYFYRSARVMGVPKKHYCGGGVIGQIAAGADALRRADAAVVKAEVDAKKSLVDAALTLTVDLCRACGLVAEAAMLAAGYHRPSRHPWRSWRHGRRVLARCRA